ncbi:MAG: single-stranded-DNA-specific exonuclease RecJ [Sphingomonadaceae bacterium]
MAEWAWRIAEPLTDGSAPDLEVWPWPLPQLLFNRGLRSAQEVEEFLYPETIGLHDPFLLRGMDVAVDRICRALRDEELIGLYGDFDVDGLTSVALLAGLLESEALQGHVVTYLPHRTKEGYGLNSEAIWRLAQTGVRLLVTADCGVGADREVRLAGELGMDVIVTDHHLVAEGPPPALAVLNPRQGGCEYPCKDLAGVGVAYKLAEAVLSRVWGLQEARRRLEPELDLVALGTVADLVPLVGENRLLVRLGLPRIQQGGRTGLRALMGTAGYAGRPIDADSIAYGLAPRLNAAGRMGDARLGLDLLTCRSEDQANRIAEQLEAANRERQAATAAAINCARKELSRLAELPPAIVVAGDYSAGVVGLVASKLAEEFQRPAFVVEVGPTESRGSGRGVAGFDVVRALAACSDLLLRFGGHAQAGGFAVPTPLLPAVQQRLEAAAAEQIEEAPSARELFLEAGLALREIGPSLYHGLSLLEPFGSGNPHPVFYTMCAQVREARIVGSNHLKLWLSDGSGTSSAIGFGMGIERFDFARRGSYVDCAYTISRNERHGTVGYEMVLKDLRPSTGRSPAL